MGLPEDNQTLRKLARSVMQGELAREDYFRRRRRVIDEFAGDPVRDEADTPTLGMNPVDVTYPDLPPLEKSGVMQAAIIDSAEDRLQEANGGRGDLWIGLVAVLLVVSVVWGLVALFV